MTPPRVGGRRSRVVRRHGASVALAALLVALVLGVGIARPVAAEGEGPSATRAQVDSMQQLSK